MPRIADALERESRSVDLEQGDFERLLGRRERKLRNRRIRAGAAAVIVVLTAGMFLTRSLTSTGFTPGSSATAEPPPVVSATWEPVPDAMTGGRYSFGPFGDLTLVATGPDGWVGIPDWAMSGPEPVHADAPTGIGIAFFTANGVYSDPCHWDVRGTGDAGTPGDVVVGPTVDDLVAALRANTFYTTSKVTPVTIDGYTGKELKLQLPDDPFTTCDKDDPTDTGGHAFVFSGPGLYAQGPANIWHLYILDVEGVRFISVILSYAKTPQTDLDLARNSIETLDINP